MPESILNRFVVLESSDLAGCQLRLRFVPDLFDVQHADPVLLIEVILSVDKEEVDKKVSLIKKGLIDEIETDQSTVSIWIEYMDSPISFLGSVTWQYEDYGTPDYIGAIKTGDLIRDELNNEIVQLRQKIDRALRFIHRTTDRIQKKRDLAHSDNARYAEQIQLLKGVRRQLEDD